MSRSRSFPAASLLAAAFCALSALPLAAQADPHGGRDHDRWSEHRYRGGPYSRGVVVQRLPPRHRTIIYGGMPYYFDGGLWYRPWGGNFVVVAPPVGIVLPVLPNGYVTLNVGGRMYYRYDDVYYVRRNDGYIVVDPPLQDGADAPYDSDRRGAPLARDEVFIYPNRGQGERLQRNDRFECHEWAVGQTGYDPTLAGGGSGYSPAHRADYTRALSACLEGRGYTVR